MLNSKKYFCNVKRIVIFLWTEFSYHFVVVAVVVVFVVVGVFF